MIQARWERKERMEQEIRREVLDKSCIIVALCLAAFCLPLPSFLEYLFKGILVFGALGVFAFGVVFVWPRL